MKTVESSQFAANVDEYLREAVSQAIVVTKSGRPCAIVHGLDYDEEQLQLMKSHEFWSAIAQRRKRTTIPWEEAEKRLKLLNDANETGDDVH